MRAALYLVAILGGLSVLLGFSYWRWQELTERERFLLAMKQAATPEAMKPAEKVRLELLRSPWWGVWRWLPDLWHRPPPP